MMPLIKKLNINIIYGIEHDLADLGQKFWNLIEKCYNNISLLLNSKCFPEECLLIYTYKVMDNISIGIDAWNCLTNLIKKN